MRAVSIAKFLNRCYPSSDWVRVHSKMAGGGDAGGRREHSHVQGCFRIEQWLRVYFNGNLTVRPRRLVPFGGEERRGADVV